MQTITERLLTLYARLCLFGLRDQAGDDQTAARGWLFRTRRGTFFIIPEARGWRAHFDGIDLGRFRCPSRAAYAIANGETIGPYIGGLALLNIPQSLKGWEMLSETSG
jgi:hypothetical protein